MTIGNKNYCLWLIIKNQIMQKPTNKEWAGIAFLLFIPTATFLLSGITGLIYLSLNIIGTAIIYFLILIIIKIIK